VRHLLKDVRLVAAEAERLGLAAPHLDGVSAILEWAVAAGLADADYSALAAVVDPGAEPPSGSR
jgi:3-hydroxyisobutyrate dehydrogenase-like beta-hydroxyacid dehydrogenase